MSGDASGNGKDSGGQITHVKVPNITIVFDPTTMQLTISGWCPTHEVAKMILLAAADEEERTIQGERTRARISLATADVLDGLPKRSS